ASVASFGAVDTPLNNTDVVGAVGVTGWAIDDVEVTTVWIYRDPVAGEPLPTPFGVPIGQAVFSFGARSDITAAYPTYPLKERGGWGLQILTNMLPNSSGAGARGNGTYTIRAVATDAEGHTALLGSRLI